MGARFRSVLRSAVAVLGIAIVAERLWQAWKYYRQLQIAMSLGDSSGADGWRTFMTVDLVEAAVAILLTFGLVFVLRPRAAAR